MTLLALIGAESDGVSACAAWLARETQRDLQANSPVGHAMLVVAPETHAQVLAALPAALGIRPPAHWPDALGTGFHPLRLGGLSLVVCVGQPAAVLAECVCAAQRVWAGQLPAEPTLPGLVARACAPQAELTWDVLPQKSEHSAWLAAGFKPEGASADEVARPSCHARYEPRWPVTAVPTRVAGNVMVIGAGLAGAAAALCLVRAGWQVCLVDQLAGPAQGASALPVGMLSTHITAHDTLMSELSRTGMPLHLRELQTHVAEGHGWQRTHVTNLKGVESDDDADDTPARAPLTLPAALVRPAALVTAWLAEAAATGRLTTLWSAQVASLSHTETPAGERLWQALDSSGATLAQAPHVVVAAAYGSAALLEPHTDMTLSMPLRAVKGQMTLAPLRAEPLADHAMRQHGVFVPAYDDADHPLAHRLWAMGSTYERGQNNRLATHEAHARNAASLAAMHPAAHARLVEQAAQGDTVEWAEVRCASLDRLPLAGALPAPVPIAPSASLDRIPRVTGLWAVCALGSRGLTLAMLAAQLLVARMQGSPLPVTRRHAAALDPARFALKLARKQAAKSTVAVSHSPSSHHQRGRQA